MAPAEAAGSIRSVDPRAVPSGNTTVVIRPAETLSGAERPSVRRELTALMGCRASVIVVGPDDPALAARLLTVAEWRLRDLESRWSRFLADSEITRLARYAGEPVAVSAPTRGLVRALVEAWDATGGVFDPTRLPDLVRAGYAASVLDPEAVTVLPAGAVSGFDPAAIRVDDEAGTVRLPVGATLDPGGLGKGLAADLVVAELLDRGAEGAMVEIGGDLRVAGLPPNGGGWRIDLEDPHRPDASDPLAVVVLLDGGVATSSRLIRKWPGGHHLLDPATGAPSDSDVVAATVVTATGAWSEAFATVPLVRGSAESVPMLDAEGIAALLCLADGSTVTTRTWTAVAP